MGLRRLMAAGGVVLLACASLTLEAQGARGTLRTDTLWSQALGVRKAVVVYLPPSYERATTKRYPVLIYLHGLTGNERNWGEQGRLGATMDSLVARGTPEAIVVMPDGDDSWYTTWNALNDPTCRSDPRRAEPADSYCVPWPHYDDYIAHDVIAFVDERYRTIARREGRAIGGLSMGGYGAVTLALRYPERFAAAASHSGVVSPRLLRSDTGTSRYAADTLGFQRSGSGMWRYLSLAFGRDSIGWKARDPGIMAARLRARGTRIPALRLDCGVDDPYIAQNRDFHRTLERLGIAHEYVELPGTHSWSYWRANLPSSITFLLREITARTRATRR